MDVLKPALIYIDTRCYRVNNPDDMFSGQHTGGDWDEESNIYVDSEYLQDQCEMEEDFEITTTENGQYKTSFHVSQVYFGLIIGAKGVTRKRLEDETRTQIRIPNRNSTDDVVITGSSRSGVAAARHRIDSIVQSSRRKKPFTHFLCIPMLSPSIKEGFLEFKRLVLESTKARGVDDLIFQTPEKLHLTLGILVLMDDVERNKAVQVLQQCKLDVIDPFLQHKPLHVRLYGVDYMNDDPSEVRVLYAKVQVQEGDHILQELADKIVDYFCDAGLMYKQYEKVMLHVTVMNIHFKEPESGIRSKETFDAAPILEKFNDFTFGEDIIDEVHLSQRNTVTSSGFYQATVVVPLTEDKNK